MDTNRAFELNVSDYFHSQGYEVDVTRSTGDWGQMFSFTKMERRELFKLRIMVIAELVYRVRM